MTTHSHQRWSDVQMAVAGRAEDGRNQAFTHLHETASSVSTETVNRENTKLLSQGQILYKQRVSSELGSEFPDDKNRASDT